MAVASLVSLHGQDPDDITEGSSSCEEEELMDCATIRDSDAPRPRGADYTAGSHSSTTTHLLLLHKRISQAYPHQLSPQALLLLANYTKPPAAPTPDINDPIVTELESLRELITAQPTKMQVDDESSPSCLITHALDYIDHMNQEIQSLHEAIQDNFCYSNARTGSYDPHPVMESKLGLVKVEHLKDFNLHVHVQCNQRRGLLSTLLFTLENLGLVIDQMDISCNQMLTLDVITSKVKQKGLDGKFVEQALQATISNDFQNI